MVVKIPERADLDEQKLQCFIFGADATIPQLVNVLDVVSAGDLERVVSYSRSEGSRSRRVLGKPRLHAIRLLCSIETRRMGLIPTDFRLPLQTSICVVCRAAS